MKNNDKNLFKSMSISEILDLNTDKHNKNQVQKR